MWISVFYFLDIVPTICIFIKTGYKRFLKTNSTDPRQRVPLNIIGRHFPITEIIRRHYNLYYIGFFGQFRQMISQVEAILYIFFK